MEVGKLFSKNHMSNMPKVAIIESGGWGGICHYTYNLANAVARAGFDDLTVITAGKYELDHLEKRFKLIKGFDTDKGYVSSVKVLFQLLRREKPSLIHVQSIFSPRKDCFFFILARIFQLPVVYTVHNILPHDKGEMDALFVLKAFRTIYKNSTKLITHSEANRSELLRLFEIPPEKIKVIPHGNYLFLLPAIRITQDEARKKIGLGRSNKVILFFGSIRRYKGIDYLIRAFKEIAERLPGTKLIIVGKPLTVGESSPIESYHLIVKELGLSEDVLFYSNYIPLEDIHIYFTASDVVALPYLDTTESGSLQLALAFSKPVVATRVGSFSDAIDEAKNGFLVPPGDIKRLAGAIINVLAQGEKGIEQMGIHSREVAENRYNWDKIGRDTAELYREVLSASS